MAQLPPKIPTMAPACWSEFGGGHHHHHQRSPSAGTFLAAPMPPPQQQPSWVDEFLDFSAAKRGAHRRSVSDSVAFLEHGPDGGNAGVGAHDFDRLDDEQLLSMFSDDLPPPPQQQQEAAPAPAPVASSSSPSDTTASTTRRRTGPRQRRRRASATGTPPPRWGSPPQSTPSVSRGDFPPPSIPAMRHPRPRGRLLQFFVASPRPAGSWRTGSRRSGRACASCSTSRSWSAASRRFRC
jgi:cyclic AMP-dependent transcription factor ATF-4